MLRCVALFVRKGEMAGVTRDWMQEQIPALHGVFKLIFEALDNNGRDNLSGGDGEFGPMI